MNLADDRLSPYELALFKRVESRQDAYALADLSVESLRSIADHEGNDFATAMLYRCLRESATHCEFIRRVESYNDTFSPSFAAHARLVIVPGAFYREFPESGADGQLLLETALELGMQVDVIPLKSFGSLNENAKIIIEWLRQHNNGPLVLVSLSKGGSDLKTALAEADAQSAFRTVQAWISLSGVIYGTPIVRWLRSSKLRSLWYRFLLRLRGYDFRVVGDMDCDPLAPLAADFQAPPHMKLIHVVGFPLQYHMTTPLARRMYRRIQRLGPNDGGTLLADVLRLPGSVYPVWSSDHYLRPAGRDMQHLMRAILHDISDVEIAPQFQEIAKGART